MDATFGLSLLPGAFVYRFHPQKILKFPAACSVHMPLVILPAYRTQTDSSSKAPYLTSVSCFFSEFLATAVLCIMVLAINDSNNLPTPPGLAPLFLFILILGIGTLHFIERSFNPGLNLSICLGASLGMETGYAINPARVCAQPDFRFKHLTS